MPILQTLEWIETTELSTAIREGALYYPILGGVHLLGIALFGGMALVTDLRLLGWALRTRPVADVVNPFRAWKRFGLAIIVSAGLLLAWAEPLKLYRSPAFWVKMGLLAMVGVHSWVFRDTVYGNAEKLDALPEMPGYAKLAGVLSLTLWTGLIFAGRLIAFNE